MGSKNNKIENIKKYENKTNNKLSENSSIDNHIIKENIFKNIPNPIFKKREIFGNKTYLFFEIYQLKNSKNSFYIAIGDTSQGILIYKYFIGRKQFKKINKIKTDISNLTQIIIKYFYNPITKKEYLFILKSYNDIEIYLIKNKNTFKLINKETTLINQFENDLRYSVHDISYIDLFDIFYNQYDNNIYVITTFYFGEDNSTFTPIPNYTSKTINIQILKNEKLELLKEFIFEFNNSDIFNLIYENKYLKRYYILIIKDNNIQLKEIKQNYNDITKDDLIKLNEIFQNENNYSGFIINDKNTDYLYINCKNKKLRDDIYKDKIENNLIIIDLIKKTIVNIIKLSIGFNSIINWNDKKIIFISDKSFYIFDTSINHIISKYNIGENKDIDSIKPFISIKNNFYSLFIHRGYIEYYIID